LLSTSDKGEGWGAVINEAMNRGCAVVCAKQIGCADSLATKENSVLYKTFSVRDLRRALKEAWQNHALLSEKGYETITCYFNAEVAARRFISLAEDGVCEWDNGLCSRVYK
jgi:glycosyltransferase involved in cell wall biosynthesis